METKTYDSELFEKLRRLRMDIARERNIRPYMVFHNSVLKEIATIKPTTKEQLLLIKGIGDKKIEKYGERVLNVIMAHLSERK
ncbi:MAG: HRDC domain-containing protein [archaeon]|nr:HRDC domain-containing protein [archaeon]